MGKKCKKNLVKQQKTNIDQWAKRAKWSTGKGDGRAAESRLYLPPFPSLDYHSARFAHLFSPQWSWVPGQMDKEKDSIQTLLGKHKKISAQKKKIDMILTSAIYT